MTTNHRRRHTALTDFLGALAVVGVCLVAMLLPSVL